MMRAVVHDTFGEPDSVLHVEDRDIPQPGLGQVRIAMTLSPIHNHDLWTVRGTYGFTPELPAQAGTEALGIIHALGDDVENFTVGQRVVTGSTFGVWAQYAVTDVSNLIPVPDELDDETAAQLVAMPFSAISLLDVLNLSPGDWLVQNSANGAVGRILAQLATARGINVLGLVRRDAGVEELAAHGIDNIISTEQDGWQDRAAEIIGDGSVPVGLDSVGGTSARDIISLLSEGAELVSFGAMGSPTMEIPSGAVIFKDITIRGFWGSKVSRDMEPSKRTTLFGELIQRLIAGEVTLPVGGIFDIDQITEAVSASFEPGPSGRRPASSAWTYSNRSVRETTAASLALATWRTKGQFQFRHNTDNGPVSGDAAAEAPKVRSTVSRMLAH